MLAWFKSLFCKHAEREFVRNVYGDEINELHCRSIWRCAKCKRLVFDANLHQ